MAIRLAQRAGGGVLHDLCDGIRSILLVRTDHAARTALDPSDHVFPAVRARLLVAHAAADVPDQSAARVKWNVVDRSAAVADRAQDEAALDLLTLTCWHRPQAATSIGLDPVANDLQRRHRPVLALAEQGDRRAVKAQRDPVVVAGRLALCELAQQLDVAPRGRVRLLSEPTLAVLVQLELRGVDVDVGARQGAELPQLRIGEGGLGGSPAPEQDDLFDLRLRERGERVIGSVGLGQLGVLEHEHPSDVDGDVAVADHDCPARSQVELFVRCLGMAVVPRDEPGRGIGAGPILAGDPEPVVIGGADGIHDCVVALQRGRCG